MPTITRCVFISTTYKVSTPTLGSSIVLPKLTPGKLPRTLNRVDRERSPSSNAADEGHASPGSPYRGNRAMPHRLRAALSSSSYRGSQHPDARRQQPDLLRRPAVSALIRQLHQVDRDVPIAIFSPYDNAAVSQAHKAPRRTRDGGALNG